jgi:hypothetical protein
LTNAEHDLFVAERRHHYEHETEGMRPEDPNSVDSVEALPEAPRRPEECSCDGRELAQIAVVRQLGELDVRGQRNVVAQLARMGPPEEEH